MAKTVMLSDDAYAALKDHKKDGESFSDVIRKLSKCGSGKGKQKQDVA